MEDTMQECIGNCRECAEVCRRALAYCQEKGGEYSEEAHLKLLEDCSAICTTSAEFMERNSNNHDRVCGLCADICDLCADSCEAFDDPVLQECARVCRRCAESCHTMSEVL